MSPTPASSFGIEPTGAFRLAIAQEYFGGWPTTSAGDVVMAFPIEGWRASAGVVMRQDGGTVDGIVHGAGKEAERAWEQALATVSLDVDGRGFEAVARRDAVVGRLWAEHGNLRPVLFHSPYEAACAFLIGHRITIAQTRRIRAQMAAQLGARIAVGDQTFHAFPTPAKLLELDSFVGVAGPKIERLHAVAQAALEGGLARRHLLEMPEADALAYLKTLPGVGDFFAQGILSRGAGLTDFITDDDLTPRAVELAYAMGHRPSRAEVLERAESWRPYRMWALVLLHVWLRRQPKSVIGPRQFGRGARGPRRPQGAA
ncbi:MAG: DNA-3-methyladenine glycosylase 2 family protein [Candidatus Dormiibacterota bacterium]